MKPQFSDASFFFFFLAAMHCNFFPWYIIKPQSNQYKVCLDTAYFAKTKNLLLKVLYIKIKISWNSTVGLMNSTKKMQWSPWIVVK